MMHKHLDWTMLLLLLHQFAIVMAVTRGIYREHECEEGRRNLRSAIRAIIEEIAEKTTCMVFVTDPIYRPLTKFQSIDTSLKLLRYEIALQDDEDFPEMSGTIQRMLENSKTTDCNAYVILVKNANLVAEFLKYTERDRLINTHGLFLILHDKRLFRPNLRYLWKRIINVVFVHQYNAYKRYSCKTMKKERIDFETVYYPSQKKSFTVTKYIDSWYHGKLRYGSNHFLDKISDLQKRPLRVAVFEHVPAVTEKSRRYYDAPPSKIEALGIEFELMQLLAKVMNFKAKYYVPHDIALEKWGTKNGNDSYTGLLREVVKGKAVFYLADLHYTLRHLNYFDLTVPYNTECLTFLTPESLTDSSWKLLILPFRLYTWIALFFTLIAGGAVFYFLSLFYEKHISYYNNKITRKGLQRYQGIRNLYLFTEVQNCILYAYSMIVQVSLPGLPNLMAVRMLIGWWWIYSILVAVSYRASMTATLANPVNRVTIDTLTQLAESPIQVGGWNKDSKEFFLKSSDTSSQRIGNKFQAVDYEDEAIEKVTNGTFGYYESTYLLRHARVKRQLLQKQLQDNNTENVVNVKHNLHIMKECTVNMPVAIGMEKNSPLKPLVDIWIRRIIEFGLVEKWLSDVMEWSKITELTEESEPVKALVNFHKLQGAFIGIAFGYFLGLLVLITEILYWKYIILRDPAFDKYHLDLYYSNNLKRGTK